MFDQMVTLMTTDEAIDAVASDASPADADAVRAGAVLAAAAVVRELARRAQAAVPGMGLRSMVADVSGSGAPRSGSPIAVADYPGLGAAPAARLFGGRRERLEGLIAGQTGLSGSEAGRLLAATTWAALAGLWETTAGEGGGGPPDGTAGDTVGGGVDLQAEAAGLAAQGWDRWFDLIGGDEAATAVPSAGPTREPADAGGPLGSEPSRRTGVPSLGDVVPGAAADARAEPRRPRRLLLVGVLAVVMMAGIGLALTLIGSGDDGSTGAGGGGEGASAVPPSTGLERTDSVEAGQEPGSATTTASADAPPSSADPPDPVAAGPEVVSYQFALADPQGRTDAAGTLQLELHTGEGRLCYDLQAAGLQEPFPGHVHVGEEGESGGIVVDLGSLAGSPSGCVQSHPADLTSIVADPAYFYVELHDPVSGESIRGQLAPETDHHEEEEEEAEDHGDDAGHDHDGGYGFGSAPAPVEEIPGAVTVIADGQVVLRGQVPDEATRGQVVATVADLRAGGIEVVDELEVVAGAPEPSGRIIVADPLLFGFDDTEVTGTTAEVIADLARILQAAPEWRATLVGNTDGVGDMVYNLVLSLKRAIATRDTLIEAGVAADAVTIRGDGPFTPVADNQTATGRRQNRRIDIVIESSAG